MGLRRLHSSIMVSIAVLLPASRATAQELRGIVRDSLSRQPIAGAVLVFRDSAGTSIGRNITNQLGEYRVALHPAMRRMEVLRIGFRPREVSMPRLENGIAELDLTMVMIPHLLEPTRVVDNPACSRRDDRAAAFALWEQARAGLLATVVAREANPARVMRYSFDRTMDRDGKHAVQQTILVDTAETGRPFVAAESAADFVEHGFLDDSAGIGIFHGPDADVLLDDAFARGYCFSLADRDRNRSGQLGLAFEPAKHDRKRIDIIGAIWIDTASRSLVDVVWRYQGLDHRLERYEPGGRVSFRTMSNGTVMIDRWFIRVVGGGATQSFNTRGEVLPLARAPQIHENGGELADARWPDGSSWHASLAAVRGRAHLPTGWAGAPITGRVIHLVGTPYEATLDSAGYFHIADLLPGPYEIGVVDDDLMKLGLLLTAKLRFEAVRDSLSQISFELATPEAFAAASCEADAQAFTDAILIGKVSLPDGRPAMNAKVSVRVEEDGNLRLFADGKTNDRGLFHICRAPRDLALFVYAELPGYEPGSGLGKVERKIGAIAVKLKPRK